MQRAKDPPHVHSLHRARFGRRRFLQGSATLITSTALMSGCGTFQRPRLLSTFEQDLIRDWVPRSDSTDLVGYADARSIREGPLLLKIRAPLESCHVSIYRLGMPDRQYLPPTEHRISPQKPTEPEPYKSGAGWIANLSLDIGDNWPSGIYFARLANPHIYDVWFVLRRPPKRNGLAVLVATNTWHAYNEWGGASFYTQFAQHSNDVKVSFERPPYDPDTLTGSRPTPQAFLHLIEGDRFIFSWLDAHSYAYDTLTDLDLHENDGVLAPYRTLVLPTHTEYWSMEMREALAKFLASGGNVVSLGGNAMYRRVEIRGTTMSYRGYWHDYPGYETPRLLGVQLVDSAVGPTNVNYPQGNSKPYVVQAGMSKHWALDGCGLQDLDRIGWNGLNRGCKECATGAAAGWETDNTLSGMTPSTPEPGRPGPFAVLAEADEYSQGQIVISEPRNDCGGVFAVGSITFGGSLLVDPALTRIVSNVLKRFGHEPEKKSPRAPETTTEFSGVALS